MITLEDIDRATEGLFQEIFKEYPDCEICQYSMLVTGGKICKTLRDYWYSCIANRLAVPISVVKKVVNENYEIK